MLEMDNRTEVDLGGATRVVEASRFWTECANHRCRARGPVRMTREQDPTSDLRPLTSGNAGTERTTLAGHSFSTLPGGR